MASASLDGLRVYQVSGTAQTLVWNLATTWQPLAKETVGVDIIRAADNIGASIAAGFGRGTYADNRRFASIARGSLMEVKHCLRRAQARDIISAAQAERIHVLVRQVPVNLNAYLKAIAKNAKSVARDGTTERFR